MKRPGQDLSFGGLVNKHVGGSRGSDLDKETKPPPISIISNLKDIDNAYGGDTYKPASERRSAYSQSHVSNVHVSVMVQCNNGCGLKRISLARFCYI